MANEKRLIDANALMKQFYNYYDCVNEFTSKNGYRGDTLMDYEVADMIYNCIENAPTVDAVEVPDKKLLKAINLLIKQYEHSKNSDYVHSPVAHAFYYTWKQLDEKMDGDVNV